GPVGTGGGGLEGAFDGLDVGAGLVLQLDEVHLVLLGVVVFDVADRVRQALHVLRHAFVALAADAVRRPVHGGAFTDLGLPVGVDLRQVVREDEAGARAVGAVHG